MNWNRKRILGVGIPVAALAVGALLWVRSCTCICSDVRCSEARYPYCAVCEVGSGCIQSESGVTLAPGPNSFVTADMGSWTEAGPMISTYWPTVERQDGDYVLRVSEKAFRPDWMGNDLRPAVIYLDFRAEEGIVAPYNELMRLVNSQDGFEMVDPAWRLTSASTLFLRVTEATAAESWMIDPDVPGRNQRHTLTYVQFAAAHPTVGHDDSSYFLVRLYRYGEDGTIQELADRAFRIFVETCADPGSANTMCED